jgi:hypothetical protein
MNDQRIIAFWGYLSIANRRKLGTIDSYDLATIDDCFVMDYNDYHVKK